MDQIDLILMNLHLDFYFPLHFYNFSAMLLELAFIDITQATIF